MAKYLLLYGSGKMPETPDEQAAVMKAWEEWFSELGPAVVDPGNPFTLGGTPKRVTSDGSIGDTQSPASGYSIIEADSLDDAAKKATGCPVLRGGADITVFETFEVM